jgi:hypothetical protein
MSVLILRKSAPVPLSALAEAANQLGPGQSIKFADLPESLMEFGTENADFIRYGSSGVWDPIRKQARYIGRRNSTGFPYHGLVYYEATHTFANDWPLWSSDAVSAGHGYDHNAINPANGHQYFREYDSQNVYEEDGAGNWTTLAALGTAEVAGALAHIPIGLVYSDRKRIRVLEGEAWRQIASFGDIAGAYHAVSQYNPIAQLLLFGAGNADKALRSMDLNETIADIPTPAIELGSSEDHGVFTHDPNSDEYFGWQKASTSWQAWGPGDANWRNLTQADGDGSVPDDGTPNLSTASTGRNCIAIPIPAHDGMEHGVNMFIQSLGGAGHAWLYRHS